MAFIRGKWHGGRCYYYLVENYREDGHTRQRVIRYIGTKRPRGRQRGFRGT